MSGSQDVARPDRFHRLRQQNRDSIVVMLNINTDFEHPSDQLVGDCLRGTAIGGHSATVNHNNAAGESNGEIKVVQDRDHGCPVAGAPAGDFDQFDLMAQIQT